MCSHLLEFVQQASSSLLEFWLIITWPLLLSFQGKLLVGHDLKSDLSSLGFQHQERFDTCKNAPLRELAGLPVTKKPKLSVLYQALTGKHKPQKPFISILAQPRAR